MQKAEGRRVVIRHRILHRLNDGEIYPLPARLARCQNGVMASTPNRPGKESERDEEIRRELAKRDATFEQERETVVDAKKATAALRRKLQHARPH